MSRVLSRHTASRPPAGSAGEPGPAHDHRPDPLAAAMAVVARETLLWLSRQTALQRATAELAPARMMARRFVAGERREDALAVASALAARGILATVAFLGEHTHDPAAARAAVDEYRRLLHDLAAAGLPPWCSLKLTQLGLQIDSALAAEGLRRVLAVADEVGGFVRIDMEGAEVLPATLDIFERVSAERGTWDGKHAPGAVPGRPFRLGVVIQAYLRRSEDDVRRLIAHGAPIRLVKGAYAEPASIAYPRRAEVDAAYLRLADLLLSPEARTAGVYPAFATHDPALIAAVRRLARARGIPPDAYEFQMLLGVRRDLQAQLARAGLRLRLYVPYGSQWYPYFMRRLAERPANLLFLLRNLLRH